MFRRFSVNFAIFSIFLDGLLVAAALYLSVLARPALSALPFLQELPVVEIPTFLYLVFPILWICVLLLFSVYDGRKNLYIQDEVSSLALGSILATISLAGLLYLSYRDVSRFLFLMTAVLAFSFMLGWRIVARLAFRKQGLHSQARRVLVLGAGTVGQQVGEQIRRHPHLGLALAGFLDDDPAKSLERGHILGGLDDARAIVQERAVDDVIIALPLSAHLRMTQVICDLRDLPVRVWAIPDYFSLALHQAQAEVVAGIPMLDLRAPALNEYQRMVKRVFDLSLSLLMLPVSLPVMGVAALAIWLDNPGPVFFLQRRAGENGKEFNMVKFRTMVVNAERLPNLAARVDENGRAVHKVPDDPRVTRVGRFLRRTSLDELPQLFNVLKGEMSLVGPRPEMPDLVEHYDVWQRKRFAVPQGMTGWWQINGRSDKPMHLHTDEDLYYVQHYSIWLDLRILCKTVWVVLRGKGAY